MLSSITPLGERGRHNRFGVTATAFVVGAARGRHDAGRAVSDGSARGCPSGRARSTRCSSSRSRSRVQCSTRRACRRSSDKSTRTGSHRYRGWVYGLGFGAQLGFGVVTVVTSAATYVAFVARRSHRIRRRGRRDRLHVRGAARPVVAVGEGRRFARRVAQRSTAASTREPPAALASVSSRKRSSACSP